MEPQPREGSGGSAIRMDPGNVDLGHKAMSDAVKSMIRKFRQLETPFLRHGGGLRNEKGYPQIRK